MIATQICEQGHIVVSNPRDSLVQYLNSWYDLRKGKQKIVKY